MSTRPVIGVVGGIGPQASAHLHALLVAEATHRASADPSYVFPEIVHHSLRVPPFAEPGPGRDEAVADIVRAADNLAAAGAHVLGLACNTAHLLLDEVERRTGHEFLRIPHLVRDEVGARALRRVGLLATATTITQGLYSLDGTGADLVPSSRELTQEVGTYIRKVYLGTLEAQDSETFRALVERFARDEGLDGVVLGCTELPVAYGAPSTPLVVDSLVVLAHGLLDAAENASDVQEAA